MSVFSAFTLVLVTATCVLVSLRALGLLRMPCAQMARRADRWQPLHWVPTSRVGKLHRLLVEKGYLVLNVDSTNGMTLLAIYEVTW